MSPRHIKRAIEEFNIKIPKRLEEKEEKKPPPQYNCQVKICPVYCQFALKSCRSKSCHLQPESCRPKFLVTSKVLELGHIYSELSLLKVLQCKLIQRVVQSISTFTAFYKYTILMFLLVIKIG